MQLDYRHTLKEAFFERRSRNSSYSLRAFARDLNLQVSNLSLILNRKRGVSEKAAAKISERLGLSESEKKLFCTLVAKEHSRSDVARKQAGEEIEKLRRLQSNLSLDVWSIVGNWHYFALMEMLRLPNQSQDPSALAKALELKTDDVISALEKLLKVGMIEVIDSECVDAKYAVTRTMNWSPDGIPSEVTRKAHDRILAKASEAIYRQTVEERDFTAMMFTLDQNDLPEAKAEIRAFHQKFIQKYSNKTGAEHVYSLNLQLYNLTTGKAGKTEKKTT